MSADEARRAPYDYGVEWGGRTAIARVIAGLCRAWVGRWSVPKGASTVCLFVPQRA